MLQEDGLFTYFADPWITERDRHFAVDKEVKFRDSRLFHSVKPIKPVVYGKLGPSTIEHLFFCNTT